MPFTCRISYSFTGQAQGWSESYYVSSPDGNLTTVAALVDSLAQKRAQLLASTYTLQIVRCSVVLDAGGNKVLRQGTLAEPNYTGSQGWAPATPNMALLTEWSNANDSLLKKQYIRGIPALLGNLGKAPDFNPPNGPANWTSLWNAWTSAMVAYPAGWLTTAQTAQASIIAYEVNAVTGQVEFTLGGTGFAAWTGPFPFITRVYVKLPGKNPLDGAMSVWVTSATSCFTPQARPAAPLPTGQVGIMSLRAPTLTTLGPLVTGGPVGSIDPQRIISHKTGRPIYASRGRRPVVVRW